MEFLKRMGFFILTDRIDLIYYFSLKERIAMLQFYVSTYILPHGKQGSSLERST